MAIAKIAKRIRRLVTVLPQGELIVDLLPSSIGGPEIALGIKGKPTSRIAIDLEKLYAEWTTPTPAAALEVVNTPEDSVAGDPASPKLNDLAQLKVLSDVRAKILTTVFAEDPKVNAAILAKFDGILHEKLHPAVAELE